MNQLQRKSFTTSMGDIAYWVSPEPNAQAPWLVFLPGLTADHRLFQKQVEYFAPRMNCLAWDAPSHGESRPFALEWSMDDKAQMLHDLLASEGITRPVLVGQSMGGYLSQVYLELFPQDAAGFVCIDSAPLQIQYFQGWELWFLQHTYTMYMSIPWGFLKKWAGGGVSTTPYGQRLMLQMMNDYEKREYCQLTAHGYKVLAEAVLTKRAYDLPVPAVLLCGEKDAAGSAKRYNREWVKATGLPMHWLPGAGHNSNTDVPDQVNAIIEEFVQGL